MDNYLTFMFNTILFFFLLVFFRVTQLFFSAKVRKYFHEGPYGDASTYFFLIQFFRSKSSGVPDERCLISNKPVAVPSIFMKIVGKIFPDSTLFRYSWLPNFIFYCVGVIGLCWFTYLTEFQSSQAFWIIGIFFVTQSDNLILDKFRIHYLSLQPRFLGLLLNSSFWIVVLILPLNNLENILTLILLVFLILNTSIFSRQAIILTVALYSLLSLNWILPLVLIIAFLLSALIFRNEFLATIKPQLEYSLQYFRTYYQPRAHSNRFVNFIKLNFARAFFLESHYYLPFFVIWIILISIYLELLKFNGDGHFILKALLVYSSTGIIFLFTGLRRFAFIGECWRYISYNIYFTNPILLYYLMMNLSITQSFKFLIIATYVLIMILMGFLNKKNGLIVNSNASLLSLLNHNKHELKSAIWYGIPYRITTLPVALGYGKATFEYQYGNHSSEIMEMYFSLYPFLKWSEELLSENRVSHILVQKELLSNAIEFSGFSSKELDLIYENKDYCLYKRHS